MTSRSGRHFLQLPGPSNVPDRILRAMAQPTIDHRGPQFRRLCERLLWEIRAVFKTASPVYIFPGSGSGGWEAALVNTLSPGDRVVIFDQGFFAGKWAGVGEAFGLDVSVRSWDHRQGISAEALEEVLLGDPGHLIKAVLIVHNETSTGVTTDLSSLAPVRERLQHPALLMVDAVSSLACMDLRHDEWGIDVTVAGSQKGLMLPPGLSFNAVSDRAMERRATATLPRNYWDWGEMDDFNQRGFFPYTPATNLLFGLQEALALLAEEGLEHVFARHARFGSATRLAVESWGLEIVPRNADEASNAATTVFAPKGADPDLLRQDILETFDMSLGTGLGNLKGRTFRIGHLGDLNDLTLLGALAGIEMGLSRLGIAHSAGGVQRAMAYLSETAA